MFRKYLPVFYYYKPSKKYSSRETIPLKIYESVSSLRVVCTGRDFV
jgi:hypothetical protein